MDSDISFRHDVIDKFINASQIIKDFIILAPQHEKSFYKKSFFSNKKNSFKQFDLMRIVHGQFLFFNMNNVKKVGYYDEKIFLYYDETDYCLRAHRLNQKIYVIPNIKVAHKGGASVEKGGLLDLECNKNWHFMWSKFYYYKKNYSLWVAYRETVFDLIESTFKIFIYYFFDMRKFKINFSKVSGLINSFLGNKSYKRLKL